VQTEEERIAWEQLSGDYMTEESENEDGIIYYHKLIWTSESMITLFTGHMTPTKCILKCMHITARAEILVHAYSTNCSIRVY